MGSVNGITTTGSSGNIQTTTRSFSTGANYTYNGSAAQSTGDGLPSTINSLTINNSSGVALTSSVTTNGPLTLTSGALSIGANTLTLNSTLPVTSGSLTGGATSNLIINGSGAGITLPAVTLNNLTINRTGSGVTLGGATTVSGTLTLTTNPFINGANLTLGNGATISRATGTLNTVPTFGTSVNVIYTGSTAVTTGNEFPTSSSVLNNLTVNNSGGVTLNTNATVNGAISLQSGAFSIGTNTLTLNGATAATGGTLTTGTGSTVNYNGSGTQDAYPANYFNIAFSNAGNKRFASGTTRIAGAFTITGSAIADTTTNSSTVEYNGTSAQTPPNALTTYNNLTINNAAGVSVGANTTVNNTLTLASGNLGIGTNTLIIPSGATVIRTSGHVIGNLQRTFAAAGSLTFDVGTANGHSPVAVNATTGTFPANFTISATQGKLPQISGTNALARYWTLSGTGITANLTFTYLASDVTGTAANYKFIKNSSGTLATLNPDAPPTTTSATISNVSSFSDWTLAEPAAVQSGSLQFSSATYSDSETNTDHTFNAVVTRTGGTDGAVSVTYTVSDGTATVAGGDYTATPSTATLNWAAGDAADKNITITVKGDTTLEPDETVNFAITNPQGGATLGSPNTAVLTIANDEPLKYRSKASGNWNSTATWETSFDGVTFTAATTTPTAATADTIQVQSPHTVTVTADVDADQLTVDNGGTLSVNSGITFTIADGAGTDLTGNGTVATAGNITDNGQAIINKTLQINEGGFPGSGTGTYSYDQTNGVLVFNNSTGPYGVNSFNFWPTANGPQNVTVQNTGGIQMNVARTVGLLFQYAAGVSGAGNLTLNGTSQVNAGGFTSGSPTYGASSLLKYNIGAAYGRNGEWLPNVTSGAGYPNNVQLGNNTNLDLPNGSAGAFFQMAGNLTIDSGSTMRLNGSPAMTQPLNVLGSVTTAGTLNLSTSSGGDIKVGGNWTRTGTFNANGRAVTFNGAGTQTVARASTGDIETFAYLIVDKASGNLTQSSAPATNVIVTGPSGGSALQIINAGGIDLGGNGLTLDGSVAGTNVLVGGAAAPATRTVTGTGTFAITGGAKSVTNNNSKTLTFDTGVGVTLFAGFDFGANLSTVNGTLTIGGGGFVSNNAPTYGTASTLIYDCACVFGRSTEWSSATSGPGAPNNVTVNTSTDLDLGSTTPSAALQAAGNLTASNGGRVLMTLDDNSHAMTSALTVIKDVIVNAGGTLRLSTASGGDLHTQGNFTNNGTFTPNNRAVFFEGGATETVNAAAGSLDIPYIRINKSGGTVQLGNTDLQTLGPAGGNSIEFATAASTLTLNGRTLTLGSTVGAPPAGAGLSGDTAATLSLQDGGTGAGGALGTLAFVSGGQTLANLTINRTGAGGSATLATDLLVNNALNLTAGDIITGSNIITHNGASTGIGDVVGNVRRTGFANGAHATNSKSFGNPNVQISFQTGTPAIDVIVNLAKSRPTGNGFGFATAINRTYTVTQTGASGFTATFRMHYQNGDLSGTPATGEEAALDLWRFNGTSWNRVNKTGADIVTANNKWVESSLVTQFSPWTLSATPLAPTVARLRSFSAKSIASGGIALEWQTGFEADNLGFRLYREDGARRTLITPGLIAGSALTVGPKTALNAGNAYNWFDGGGSATSRYYLEDVDTNGTAKTQGPFWPVGAGRSGARPKKGVAVPLSSLGAEAASAQHQWTPPAVYARGGGKSARTSAASQGQQTLASMRAVKLLVRRGGWYRVTRAQLEAAGLPNTADPARLQLFADGGEIAIKLDAAAWAQSGVLEFYGEGFDRQATDTRAYWLIEGATAGRRMGGGAASQPTNGGEGDDTTGGGTGVVTITPVGPPAGPSSFAYTIERKDRNVYFPSLLNGEAENFFGRVVTSTPQTQTLNVRNHEDLDSAQARLEVAVQGITIGAHTVGVFFNGSQIGALEFAGRESKTAAFDVPGGWVREGDNDVQLVSAKSGDVSITDYLRLTYMHTFSADDDTLRFNASGGESLRVSGFTSGNVRVVDITDPSNVTEIAATVTDSVTGEPSGNTVTFDVGGSGERRLLAFGEGRVAQVAGALAHTPSDWRDAGNEADFVIITHALFRQAVEPLAAKRAGEGLLTKVVDVEDLYDEFSEGAHSPQAVRDGLAYAAQNWKRAPRYVLLVGDGSYDPRNYLGFGAFDLVPVKLLDTVQMETASDAWLADFDGDGLSDIAIGRLPVRTSSEAATIVSKIAGFAPGGAGAPSAVLVADRNGPDGYSFEAATDTVQMLVPAGVSVSRINRGAQTSDAVRAQIVSAVNAGPRIVNWMGHGSVNVWTGEGLLRSEDAAMLTNGGHLSLFVMMTCLNGYFHSPGLESLSESLLKSQQGGALAAWTSTGMTEPEGQAAINRELYRALYESGSALRLGDAMRRAGAATNDPDVRRTWVLIGDPTSRWR